MRGLSDRPTNSQPVDLFGIPFRNLHPGGRGDRYAAIFHEFHRYALSLCDIPTVGRLNAACRLALLGLWMWIPNYGCHLTSQEPGT